MRLQHRKLDQATKALMLQVLTIHALPPYSHFCVGRMAENIKSELLRWAKPIFETMEAGSLTEFPFSSPEQPISVDGHCHKDSARTGIWANGAQIPQPVHGSKPRASKNSSMVKLPCNLQKTTANHREYAYQPAEELAVSIPAQPTNMWLMGNAYFMSEQMAFLQAICISTEGNKLPVIKLLSIRNWVFSHKTIFPVLCTRKSLQLV